MAPPRAPLRRTFASRLTGETMPAPLFSLVIPTFNYGRFLGRAIDSALAQGGGGFEVAVVDDGSTDDTPVVAARYGASIRYVRQERGGVYRACKRGLEETTGRFLVYFDADDALAPGALDCLRRQIERRPDVGMVAGRHETVTVAGRRTSPRLSLGRSRTRNFRSFLLGRQFICTGAAALRREAVALLSHYQGALRVGMETACVAQTLWYYDAVAVHDVLLEVHEHPGRLRDNLGEIRMAGDALVDAVFGGGVLPAEAGRHRAAFQSRLLRDRSRSYHKAGYDAETVSYFHAALASDLVRTLGDVRNVRRYAISRARQRFAAASSSAVQARPSREAGVVEASGRKRLSGHRRLLRRSAIEFLRQCSTLGDVVKLDLVRPTYLLSDPRDILHVFVEQPGRYRRNGLQAAFAPLFGRGLFTRTGQSHIEHRRMIQPLLHRGRLDGFAAPMRRTLEQFLPSWQSGQTVDVSGTIMDVMLRAAGRMILGLERPEDAAELFAAIHGSHQRVVRSMQSGLCVPAWLPTKRNRTLKSNIGRLDQVMQRLIGEARQDGAPARSLLAQLVKVRDGAGAGLDDRQIRDHALTIFLAAYEPPTTGLTWILHLLARHPESQRAVQAEIDAHAGTPREIGVGDASDHAGGETAPIWQRPVMAQVIAEAMRLYPSTWLLTRRAGEDDALPSGARVPMGADVFASPLLVHRDARRYDAPEEFRQDRFAGGTTDRRAAGTYFPFGLGPTACLGEYLAKLMMAVTVEAVLGRFDLAVCDAETPRLQSFNLFTMQGDRGIRLRVTARAMASSSRAS